MSKAKPTKKTAPKKALKKTAPLKAASKKSAPKKAVIKKAAPKKAAPLAEASFGSSASTNKRCKKLPSGKWACQTFISGSWRHNTADIFSTEFQCKLRLSS